MNSPRRPLLVSTSRADVRAISAVADALAARGVRPTVVVSEVAAAAWPEVSAAHELFEVPTGLRTAVDAAELIRAGHALAEGVSEHARRSSSEIAVVMGDRHELLAVARALVIASVPIAHLDGGCVTSGSIDDSIRHAITKLAQVHLCSTEDAARRLRQLGEEEWRIHVVGDPAIDHLIEDADRIPLGDLQRELGFPIARPLVLLTYHPPTAQPGALAGELDALLGVVAAIGGTVIATSPGSDVGREYIAERLGRAASELDHFHLVPDLGDRFAAAMAHADLMVGNSSGGLVESATFALPVVDVGMRQRGRVRPPNVIHAATPSEVAPAVTRALDPGFRASLTPGANPYGDGRAAGRSADIVATVDLDRLAAKRFVDRG